MRLSRLGVAIALLYLLAAAYAINADVSEVAYAPPAGQSSQDYPYIRSAAMTFPAVLVVGVAAYPLRQFGVLPAASTMLTVLLLSLSALLNAALLYAVVSRVRRRRSWLKGGRG